MKYSSYWQQVTGARIGRRRVLAATGAGAFGAAFLAACGGGGSKGADKSASKDKSGLIHEPVESTAKAKAGGTIVYPYTTDILHFDALLSNSASTVNDVSVFTYPRMVKYALTKYPKPNEGGVEGDAMESFEVSPDKLTYTFKLRQGMKWDSRAPTSGRTIDTSDVLFSWNKFAKVNPSSPNLAYSESAPSAPIETVTSPDARTVVLKLKNPEAALLTLLAGWDQFYIMPKESDGGFDPKKDVRGYGPWLLDEYRPSAAVNWKRAPDYYMKGQPYADKLERPLVSEFAARLSQFKAGNVLTDVVEQSQQDVVQLKKDVPQTLLVLGAGGYGKNYNPVTSAHINFGWESSDVRFRDVRVRQALSMAIDREAFADFAENRVAFAKDGLDNSVAFNSSLSPAWNGYWIDPTNEKEFGPNAKYLSHNVAEAKKLLGAAGFPSGFEFDFHFCNNNYGALYLKTPEIYAGMFQEVGLKAKLDGIAYNTWKPQYHDAYIPSQYNSGQTKPWTGIGLMAERQRYTPAFSIYGMLHPEGDAFHGATADGMNAVKGDPKLNDMLAKMRLETDKNKAQEGMKEVQRYVAQQAYHIPKPSNSIPFTVWWPALANVGAYTSSPVGANRWAEHNLYWYIDTTKAPFTKT